MATETPAEVIFHDRMLSLGLARVSEAAAMASARLVGRGDEKAADQAAVNAMRVPCGFHAGCVAMPFQVA